MGKLAIIFYVFVIAVLVLFSCFTFLMSTVNPAPLVAAKPIVIVTTKATNATTATTEATMETPSKPLLKLLGYEAEGPTTSEQPKKDVLKGEVVTKPFNDTDPKKTKGRRSVDQHRKNNPGVVIMKVVDSDGKPRIEIVFYPKRATNVWKTYRENSILGSKRRKTNYLRNSILNIMPDDSIVFENNWGLDRIPGAISDKTEYTKKVFDMKSVDSNISNTLNHSESVTNINSYLLSSPYPENNTSIENPHANITTEIKMDLIDEVQRMSYKDISLETTDNLLHSTIPNLNIDSWKIAKIDIAEETGQANIETLTHKEEVTEEYTVLPTQLHTTQDTYMETRQANDTTEMKMDFSEELQKMTHKEVSVENTDNLLHSTNSSFDIVRLNKEDIGVNKYGNSAYVFDMKDLGIVLTTSNLTDGTTESNTILMLSAPETSSIEAPDANNAMKTEMGFSEESLNDNERLTELSTDSLPSTQDTMPIDNISEKEKNLQQSDNVMYINTDTLLNYKILNITIDSSNEPDILISETSTTNASHDEATLLSTQDTSSSDADDSYSTQITIDNINNEK